MTEFVASDRIVTRSGIHRLEEAGIPLGGFAQFAEQELDRVVEVFARLGREAGVLRVA